MEPRFRRCGKLGSITGASKKTRGGQGGKGRIKKDNREEPVRRMDQCADTGRNTSLVKVGIRRRKNLHAEGKGGEGSQMQAADSLNAVQEPARGETEEGPEESTW